MAMQSIMLAMGSVGQEKLACAIMVQMKNLERSYSTFCCSISDIWSFVTPPPHQTIVDLRFFYSKIFVLSQFGVISKICD